jgi:hypothetical protein
MFLQKQEEYIVVDSAGDKKFFVICGACSVSHFCNVKTFLLNVGIFSCFRFQPKSKLMLYQRNCLAVLKSQVPYRLWSLPVLLFAQLIH